MVMQAPHWPITTAGARVLGPPELPAGNDSKIVLAPKPEIRHLQGPADATSGPSLPPGDHWSLEQRALHPHALVPLGSRFAQETRSWFRRPKPVPLEFSHLNLGEEAEGGNGHRPFAVQSFLDFAEAAGHVTNVTPEGSQTHLWNPRIGGGSANDRWLDGSAAEPRRAAFRGVAREGLARSLHVRQLYRPEKGGRGERTVHSRVTGSKGFGGGGEGVRAVAGFGRAQGSSKPRILPDRVVAVVNLIRRVPPGVSLGAALVRWEGRLSLQDMNTVLKEIPNWRKAAEFLDWMKGGAAVDVFSYTILLKALLRARQWRGVEELLGAMVREGGAAAPDNVAYCIAISGASKGRRPQEAARWFAQMKVAGCQPDAVTYNAMIDAYGRAAMYREAVGVMNEMRTAGVLPDRVTYGSLLAGCGRGGGGLEEARQVFEDMKARDMVDTVAFSIMIDLCGNGGAAQEALDLFREMQGSDRCECDCASWNAVMTALGRGGRVEEAYDLFREMRASETPPDRITFSTLIWMVGAGGQCERAEGILREMEGEGWGGDEYAYNALLSAYAGRRRWEDAVRIFEEMNTRGCDYGEVTYAAMMSVFCKAGQLSLAERLFARMKEAGLVPNAVVYSCLIDAYGKARLVEKAVEVFAEMRGEGCEPNEFTYNCLIDIFGKSGRVGEAELAFQEMRLAGCKPDRVTFSSLINARGAAGQVEEAMALFRDMKAVHGCAPDAIVYGTMMKVLSRGKRFKEAVGVWEEMREAGGEPDEVMYVSGLEVFWKAGLRERAMVLFREMKGRGMTAGAALRGVKGAREGGGGEIVAKKRKGRRKGTSAGLKEGGGGLEGEEAAGGKGGGEGRADSGGVQGRGRVGERDGSQMVEAGVGGDQLCQDTLGARGGEVSGNFVPGHLLEWVGMAGQSMGFRNVGMPLRETQVGVGAQAKEGERKEK